MAALGSAALPGAALAGEGQPFGIAQFTMQTTHTPATPPFVNEPYVFDQAGGHPVALTTRVAFATETVHGHPVPTRDPKDVAIDLPPGLIADPQAVPVCVPIQGQACPVDTQVGVFVLRSGQVDLAAPIVNLAPSGEEAAKLGLETPFGPVSLFGRLARTPAGYALSVITPGLAQLGIVSIEITLWGVPTESAHDPQRGRSCLGTEAEPETVCNGGGAHGGGEEQSFLTLPTVCSGQPLSATAWADSWQEPGRYLEAQATLAPPRSCELLPFSPELTLRPDSQVPEGPVGLELTVGVRQGGAAVSPPPLRRVAVTLPQGMAIDPSIGNGLRACQASGPEGIDLPSGVGAGGQALSPAEIGEGEETGPDGQGRLAPGHCPPASTIGLAQARSPLFAGTLAGRVYLAAPTCGAPGRAPCGAADAADGALYRIYVELGGVGELFSRGVILKLPGEVLVSPATGQLTVELSEAPQLPLLELGIALFGGDRALVDNPPGCGPASTSSDLEPWGAPLIADGSPRSYYEVAAGCAQSRPFAPTLVAGSQVAVAGGSTAFSFQVARGREEQQLAQVQLHAPPGLSAQLAGVPLCPQADASAGACPAGSLIGSSTVALGNGYEPLQLGGRVYLTGPYEGAPFGLAIVTEGVVGPLDLGTIAVRARVDIDPRTAALTITSDPLPRIVLGVPLRVRALTLDIQRPDFLLDPTDCSARRVSATLLGDQGALAGASEPFAVGGCRALAFGPRLSAFTSARTSFAAGASLDIKLSEPRAAPGTEANLARLRIALPRALATRLSALQGSCPAPTFAADPARCPATSVVGVARASTPLLAAPLSGPVYLVARGRHALPSPTVVLEGQGMVLQLDASTAVERGGRTAIDFAALPDMPLREVELYLPRGPHAVLAAAGNLCAASRGGGAASLPLAVELAGHNGAVLHRGARIAVLGCSSHR